MEAATTDRLSKSPLKLLQDAAGTPEEMAAKMVRLVGGIGAYADGAQLNERLERLQRLGYLEQIPTRVQLVVHANPAYDFQLLESHHDGLLELERQTEAMIAGTHPRAKSIGAIVEEADYHERLLNFIRRYRADRDAGAPLRANIEGDPRFAELEKTFGNLPTAMEYFCSLPRDLPGAARHILTLKQWPGFVPSRN